MNLVVLGDVVRATSLVLIFCILGLSWVVLSVYTGGQKKGDLHARHVWKVALSHVVALSTLGATIAARFGEPLQVEGAVSLTVSTLTLSALIDLMGHQRWSKKARRRSTDLPQGAP